jgi:hypothetical protein
MRQYYIALDEVEICDKGWAIKPLVGGRGSLLAMPPQRFKPKYVWVAEANACNSTVSLFRTARPRLSFALGARNLNRGNQCVVLELQRRLHIVQAVDEPVE